MRGGDPTAEDEQSSTTLRLHVSLLDREPQWKHYTSTLARYFEPMGASVDFSPCDVVASMGDDCQAEVTLKLSRADLLIFSYVCHETSHAAAANDWSFYRGLATRCKSGTVLLFFDIIGRSSQCFDDRLLPCATKSVDLELVNKAAVRSLRVAGSSGYRFRRPWHIVALGDHDALRSRFGGL